MAVSVRLAQMSKSVEGVAQWPYKAVGEAMAIIPRTLVQNSGSSQILPRLSELSAKHAQGGSTWGIDGDTGKVVDMREYGVWEPEAVKVQSIKTAVEVRLQCLLCPFPIRALRFCVLLLARPCRIVSYRNEYS